MKIRIKNDEHWHRLRAECIGSSDIATLFNSSCDETKFVSSNPYKSKFTLWHEKAGNFSASFDNDRMMFGRALESAIGILVAEKHGWAIEKCLDFYKNGHLGATPDFIANGDMIVEAKNIDERHFYQTWVDGEPPETYLLQLQHQMHCSGFKKGAIVALVGGNRLEMFIYEYRPMLGLKMERLARDFFQSVKDGIEPKIESDSDLATAVSIATKIGNEVEMTGNNYVSSLIHDLEQAMKDRKESETKEKRIKAELINIANGASIKCADKIVKIRKDADSPNKEITPEMVGNIIKGRKGATKLTIKTLKGE